MRDKIPLKNCPLTGIEVKDHVAQKEYFRHSGIYYRLKYDDHEFYLGICEPLYNILTKNTEYLERNQLVKDSKIFGKYLSVFLGELGKENFRGIFNKTIHWSCKKPEKKPEDHLIIKPFAEAAMNNGGYPKTRKEKTNLILKTLKQVQTFDGEKIQMLNEFKFWGKFYLSSPTEFEYYLRQLETQDYIQIDDPWVNLTFKGLDYTENIENVIPDLTSEEEMYQIGLSFAGEERDFVEQVAQHLKNQGIKVFYDNYEKIDLWGKDLYQHLNEVYKSKCEYCIIFISENYAKKLWTGHELKSAQARAFSENREYILPVRFDEAKLPGLNDTIGYINASNETPISIAQMAIEKLNR